MFRVLDNSRRGFYIYRQGWCLVNAHNFRCHEPSFVHSHSCALLTSALGKVDSSDQSAKLFYMSSKIWQNTKPACRMASLHGRAILTLLSGLCSEENSGLYFRQRPQIVKTA